RVASHIGERLLRRAIESDFDGRGQRARGSPQPDGRADPVGLAFRGQLLDGREQRAFGRDRAAQQGHAAADFGEAFTGQLLRLEYRCPCGFRSALEQRLRSLELDVDDRQVVPEAVWMSRAIRFRSWALASFSIAASCKAN